MLKSGATNERIHQLHAPIVMAKPRQRHKASFKQLLSSQKDSAQIKLPFDRDNYLKNGKMMPVHKKPFAIESSAKTCVNLALKSGWIVAVAVEMKKVVAS